LFSNGPGREEKINRGIKALREAAAQVAQLVAFPELSFVPFFPRKRRDQQPPSWTETIPGPTTEIFAQLARQPGVVVILNLYEKEGEQTYDCSPVLNLDGRLTGVTRMVHIMEGPGFHEKDFYCPGNRGAPVFFTAPGKIGVAICYHRHYPEYMRALGLQGAYLVVIPQAGAVGEWSLGIFEMLMRNAGQCCGVCHLEIIGVSPLKTGGVIVTFG
jgi:beta-ureidopropionase